MQLQDIVTGPVTKQQFYDRVKARIEEAERKRGWTSRDRAAEIGRRSPEVAERIIASADEAVNGRLILPGTGADYFFVGNPPDWFADPVFDAEYVVGLNRMGHWKTLSTAYLLTGDRRYADKALQEADNWIDVCPRTEIPEDDAERTLQIYRGIHPWNALSTGIRMFETWPALVEQLIEVMTPDMLAKLAVSFYEHGEVLANACPVLWPAAASNHYLMENFGLLYLSCLFPEFRTSDAWTKQAMRELERCADVQLTAGGGQIEGCPHYHNHCIGWFSRTVGTAAGHGLSFSATYTERIQAGIEYSIHAFRPSGSIVPWGDSDSDLSAVYDILNAYAVFGNKQWLEIIVKLAGIDNVRETARNHINLLWAIDSVERLMDELEQMAAADSSVHLPVVSWQRELHQVMARTSWEKDALSLFFACRTPVDNGHQHMDPMGFDFTAYGRPLIVDPGRYCYREDEDRRLFKSATWHNTLTINHREPFDLISSWKYGPQKPGRVERVFETERFVAAEAMHTNYEPVIHRRLIAMVEQRYLLLLDSVVSDNPIYSVQLYYHFDSERVTLSTGRNSAYSDDAGKPNVLVHSSANLTGELLAGKVSDRLDQFRPSTRLLLRDYTRTQCARAYATLIVPCRAGERLPDVRELIVDLNDGEIRAAFQLDHKYYAMVWDDNGFTIAE